MKDEKLPPWRSHPYQPPRAYAPEDEEWDEESEEEKKERQKKLAKQLQDKSKAYRARALMSSLQGEASVLETNPWVNRRVSVPFKSKMMETEKLKDEDMFEEEKPGEAPTSEASSSNKSRYPLVQLPLWEKDNKKEDVVEVVVEVEHDKPEDAFAADVTAAEVEKTRQELVAEAAAVKSAEDSSRGMSTLFIA